MALFSHVRQTSSISLRRVSLASAYVARREATLKPIGQFGVHVLYKRLEIPAKKAVPAIAVSVTYSKQVKAANTGSTPVSATNPFRIICLQMGAQGLPLRRSVTDTAKARFQNEIARQYTEESRGSVQCRLTKLSLPSEESGQSKRSPLDPLN